MRFSNHCSSLFQCAFCLLAVRVWRRAVACAAGCLFLAGSTMGQAPQPFSIIYTFPTQMAVGSRPSTGLVPGPDGNLYGTTPAVSTSFGTIFRITPQGSLTTIYSYPTANFQYGAPGPLTVGADGALYGVDIASPRSLFRLTTDGAFSILATAPYAFYTNPYFGLLAAADGNLYGVGYDANTDARQIYQISLSGNITLIHTLDPVAEGVGVFNMIQGSDGAIYGLAGNVVGSRGHTFFAILPQGIFTVIASLPITANTVNAATNQSDSAQCVSGITEGADGNFYCFGGGGVSLNIIGLSPSGMLIFYQDVNAPMNGQGPQGSQNPVSQTTSQPPQILDVFAPMVLGLDGNLYGGAEVDSVTSGIFQLSISGLNVIYTSPKGDGNTVSSCYFGLAVGSDGSLYGTCATSTNYPNGYVFRMGPGNGGANSPVQITRLTLLDAQPGFVDADSVNNNPSGLLSDPNLLSGPGRVVAGAAADGVSRVLLRGSTTAPLTFTVADENLNPVGDSTEYGGLAQVTDPGTPFSNSVLIEPVTVSGNSMSFVAYRAPMDFVRADPNFNASDQTANSRTVNIVITASDGTVVSTYPVTLVRPPVVVIHGITSAPKFWKTFSPLVQDCAARTVSGDPRFYVLCADWSKKVHGVVAIDPDYLGVGSLIMTFQPIRQNVLGYAYNAPTVFSQMQNAVANYALAAPPAGYLPVASVQVDAVGHSMANPIVRTMPYVLTAPNGFFQAANYGQGIVHKLISIAGPHLGSPMAIVALDPANACTWLGVAAKGEYPLNSANFGTSVTTGGTLDLTGDGQGNCASAALNTLQGSADKQIPVALIAGAMSDSQLNGLDSSLQALAVKLLLGVKAVQLACGTDYSFVDYTSAGWLTMTRTTAANQSDAFVPVTSALDGLDQNAACIVQNGQPPGTPCNLSLIQNAVHGPGTVSEIGFPEPQMLDNPSVPMITINLLNAKVSDPAFATLPNIGFKQVGNCR